MKNILIVGFSQSIKEKVHGLSGDFWGINDTECGNDKHQHRDYNLKSVWGQQFVEFV